MPDTLDRGVVALFPGQGSIAEGAGESWKGSPSWPVVDQVADATGVDVAALLLGTPTDELVRTDRAQLATFALSMVGWRHLSSIGPAPAHLVGHSLGELSALTAAGVLDLADGARLVAARGAAMAAASAASPGAMVALMGPDEGALARLEAAEGVWVANVNGPGQIVASGSIEAIEEFATHSKERGWRRATVLNVGGAFHSPLMSPAQGPLDDALAAAAFHDCPYDIGANVDGQWRHGGDQWRALLSRQLTSPVQYLSTIESLPSDVVSAVEMPPAGVLIGLTKRIRDFDSLRALEGP
jgi:[acyl-carrier-protein] S-malonyltransferase